MKKLFLTITAVTLMVLGLIAPLQAGPRFFYQELKADTKDPFNPSIGTQARGLNNAGQVVGWFWTWSDAAVPFLKNPGQPLRELEIFGVAQDFPYDINGAGQVVGYGVNADLKLHAFLKNPGQPVEDLGTLGGEESIAWGINNAGQVVGVAALAGGKPRAFLKNPGQPMQELDSGHDGQAMSINDIGLIVGARRFGEDLDHYRAWLKNPDQHTTYELGTLGGTSSLALNINNTGQVVGWAEDADGNRRPFLKNPGQSMQDLGTLGGNSGLAASINHRGQVVGRAKDGSGFERAFLWDQGVMYNLNDLTVNLPSGVILSAAWAINDQGWIAGDASNNAFLLMRVEGNAYLWLLLLD